MKMLQRIVRRRSQDRVDLMLWQVMSQGADSCFSGGEHTWTTGMHESCMTIMINRYIR